MSALGKVLGTVARVAISPVAAVLGALNKPKAPTAPLPLPTVTPRGDSLLADVLARRRGSAANIKTGAGGAESSAGKKTLLGS